MIPQSTIGVGDGNILADLRSLGVRLCKGVSGGRPCLATVCRAYPSSDCCHHLDIPLKSGTDCPGSLPKPQCFMEPGRWQGTAT